MSEQVKFLMSGSPEVMLFSAMVAAAGNDIMEKFGLPPQGVETSAEVTVTVNGIEVPFIETAAKALALYDDNITERAKELLSEALTGKVRDLQQKVGDLLDGMEELTVEVQREAERMWKESK